jgi:L-aspartate oxidase
VIKTDVLVLGSGAAGLTFALEVAERSKLRVLVITKKDRSESNTNYAQGGIAGVMAPFDSFEAHIRDTLIAGAGLCHEEAVNILVLEGPERIRDLMQRGASFTKNTGGSLHLGKEGGHSANRIVHTKDLTGREVERTLLDAVAAHPRIKVLENHYAVELITERNLEHKSRRTAAPRACFGAYVLDDLTKKVHIVYAHNAVMLATGGCGQVYLHSTNPQIATGDGIAMAYRLGARIANMEFIQFHPTSLHVEGSRSYLISEAVRGAGGILLNLAGERFMVDYDADRMELAPRDIVARAIDAELKKRGDSHVLLDISHLRDKARREFPNIYAKCLEHNIDITREPIPVVPAAHYSCGGVMTDLNGRTDIERLYSCGEAAMTGVHGANRLASNSLLESLVFSRRAAADLVASRSRSAVRDVHIRPWDDSGTENAEEWVVIEHDRREVQQLMWDYVGIVRSTSRLERAERRLKLIRKEIEDYYRKTRVTMPLVELRNLAETALIIIRSALSRKESRGLHYTTDFPMPVPRLAKRDTIIVKRTST